MEVGSFFLSQKKLSRFLVGGSMVATKKSINRLKGMFSREILEHFLPTISNFNP
jgi:hypothetical protein